MFFFFMHLIEVPHEGDFHTAAERLDEITNQRGSVFSIFVNEPD